MTDVRVEIKHSIEIQKHYFTLNSVPILIKYYLADTTARRILALLQRFQFITGTQVLQTTRCTLFDGQADFPHDTNPSQF
jgi:hypothetical protein